MTDEAGGAESQYPSGGTAGPDEWLASVLSVAEDAIISIDRDHNIRFFNRGAERIFGYAASDLLGKPIDLLLPERFAAGHRRHVAEFGRSSRTARMMNERGLVTGRRSTGEEFRAEVSISKLEVGAETLYTAILRDVTERRSLEDQLQKAQKLEAIGRLAGGVAHDFNNLLTVIGGYSQMVLKRLHPEDPLYEDVAQIKRAAGRAAELTAQLLALGRKQRLAPKVVDLNDVIADLDNMLRRVVGERIEVVVALDPALGQVKVDPGQFEHVLTNLVLNARDAMPDGGTLLVETANVDVTGDLAGRRLGVTPGPYVLMSVSDTGVGMDAETKAHIFEPFFTTKHGAQGTGLGLATVYGIVTQSGGFIWVYSEVGQGTTFRILLPRSDAAEPAPLRVSPAAEPPCGTETVLVAEDETVVREFACRMLRESGYRVLEASGGPEALAIAEGHAGPIDLLLTDVVMPRMNGPALADLLRASRPATKVLYMSGYTKDITLHTGTIGREAAFIGKPFSPDELARRVRATLDSGE
jgi:PAS domain S-box-containing protein